jgi:hypothetical protein
VWRALAGAALAEARDTRAEAVMTLDPGDRALGVEAGLLGPEPKQLPGLDGRNDSRAYWTPASWNHCTSAQRTCRVPACSWR